MFIKPLNFFALRLVKFRCDKMPQKVAGNSSLSSPGAVWRILQIQELALSHGCALPCREPFLIGNLPRRLLPCFSAGVARQCGLHVTLLVPHVYA